MSGTKLTAASPCGRGGARPGAGRPKKAGVKKIKARGKVLKKSSEKINQSDSHNEKIVDIIDICSKSSVKRLKYGHLEIEFNSIPTPEVDAPEKVSAAPEPEHQMEVSDDRELTEDTRLAQLMMDDPSAFEQEVIDSHTGWSDA